MSSSPAAPPATPNPPRLNTAGMVVPGLSVTQGDVVIRAANLGKVYHVYDRPQDRLKQALFRWKKKYYRDFWALRNVSFEIHRGEALGVLGRNGAGKSTLLQLIAGTLAPTEGEVAVKGRVAAMLQLGSGFNPEFTGRENVYLGGAILGISRREMDDRFDSIAAFADIGSFLEQPLKTYSSGMAARLAFAVSFSVEPDILIVDEILAVGDIAFQHKCTARLRQMRDNGLSLLYVSHSPDSVRSICQTCLFLERGTPRFFGPADEGVDRYLSFMREETNRAALQEQADLGSTAPQHTSPQAGAPATADTPDTLRYGTGHARIERVRLLDARDEERRAFNFGDEVTIEVTLRSLIATDHLNVSFLVRDLTGVDLMGTALCDEADTLPSVRAGETLAVRFAFKNTLRPGTYGVCAAVNRVARKDYSDVVLFDQIDSAASFIVSPDPDRPIHYKFHQPVTASWTAVPSDRP